ncbi:MAG: hypothetical protein RL651_1920 [Pseudomonadota bacterium]|jgi:uncharacterized membrane protein YedE/YeeE
MNFEALITQFGEEHLLLLGGLVIGIIFGAAAQQSRFCLRAATMEVAHGKPADRMAIWLVTFAIALIATQLLIISGLFDTNGLRQFSNRGSLSGAIIGGLIFGVGMALSRACSGRMLVLTGGGNLRALLTGLVFAVAAQASLEGILAPLRTEIGSWWTIDGPSRNLIGVTGIGNWGALAFSVTWLLLGAYMVRKHAVSAYTVILGCVVGLMIAAAWWFNFGVSANAFEVVVPVHSLSFASPTSDTLMFFLSPPGGALSFDLGLIPGVLIGSFGAALLSRSFKLEGFHDHHTMIRYMIGGCFMGFGAILAGGCAIGAGVSGASVFAVTAWLTLWSIWLGAVITDIVVDRWLFKKQPG